MGLLGRMFKGAGKAMKNEVERTVRRNAMKTARKIRKRIDNRSKPKAATTRKVAKTTRAGTVKRPLKKLPKMKVRY